jgi:hypothetical protein
LRRTTRGIFTRETCGVAVEVEVLCQLGQGIGVTIHVVAFVDLAGAAISAPVLGDDPIRFSKVAMWEFPAHRASIAADDLRVRGSAAECPSMRVLEAPLHGQVAPRQISCDRPTMTEPSRRMGGAQWEVFYE